ncbi:MAG TPA: histidinol dehydrogenase, partial [Sulfitobacter sp.]|nr:histidinol dehydrogenase [Sulfitobacter sp.]
MPQFLDAQASDFEAAFTTLLNAKREDSPDVDAIVAGIIADVRARGDEAVLELTEKFDRIKLTPDTMRVTAAEVEEAASQVAPDVRAALELAATRITAYHSRQMPEDAEWTDEAGATL